jgi:hypothetical protein
MRRPWPNGGCCATVNMLCENIMAFLSENYTEHVIYYIKVLFSMLERDSRSCNTFNLLLVSFEVQVLHSASTDTITVPLHSFFVVFRLYALEDT